MLKSKQTQNSSTQPPLVDENILVDLSNNGTKLSTLEPKDFPEPLKQTIVKSQDLSAPRALIEAGVDLVSNPEILRSAANYCARYGIPHDMVDLLISHGADPRNCKGLLREVVEDCDKWDDISFRVNFSLVEALLRADAGDWESLWHAMMYSMGRKDPALTKLLLQYDDDGSALRSYSSRLGAWGQLNALLKLLSLAPPAYRQEVLEHGFCGLEHHGIQPAERNGLSRLSALGARGYRSNSFPEQFFVGPFQNLNATWIEYEDLDYIRRNIHEHLQQANNLPQLFWAAICLGDIAKVKFFVDELKVDINEQQSRALIMSSNLGHSDVLQLLIERGGDIHAQDDLALVITAKSASSGTLELLLRAGIDPRTRQNQAVAIVANRSNENKLGALNCAKLLVEAGASPRVFGIKVDIDQDNLAARYLQFMAEVMTLQSELFIQKIDPRIEKNYVNFLNQSYTKSNVFKYISNCAAVASSLGTSVENPSIFLSLARDGAQKVFGEKRGSFRDLYHDTTRELTGFEQIGEIPIAFAYHVLAPVAFFVLGEEAKTRAPRLDLAKWKQAIDKILVPLAAKVLFEDRPLLDVLRLNRDWHRPIKAIPISAQPLMMSTEWYPLVPSTELSEGYTVVSLTCPTDLIKEGEALSHCVGKGAYGTHCLTGAAHLLSLRQEGQPKATIMLVSSDKSQAEFDFVDKRFFRVASFRGVLNMAPSQSDKKAFEEFKHLIKSGQVKLHTNKFGETAESVNQRLLHAISEIELISGVPLGEFPHGAVKHYTQTVFIYPTNERRTGAEIPLLRSIDFIRYEDTFRAFLNSALGLAQPKITMGKVC